MFQIESQVESKVHLVVMYASQNNKRVLGIVYRTFQKRERPSDDMEKFSNPRSNSTSNSSPTYPNSCNALNQKTLLPITHIASSKEDGDEEEYTSISDFTDVESLQSTSSKQPDAELEADASPCRTPGKNHIWSWKSKRITKLNNDMSTLKREIQHKRILLAHRMRNTQRRMSQREDLIRQLQMRMAENDIIRSIFLDRLRC